MIDAGLGDDGGLGEGEDGGAEGLDALVGEGAESGQTVEGAGNLEDDAVGHRREDVPDLEQLLGGVTVDLDHHGLVGDVQIALDEGHDLPVLGHQLVEHDGVGDDAGRSPGASILSDHPGLRPARYPVRVPEGGVAQ